MFGCSKLPMTMMYLMNYFVQDWIENVRNDNRSFNVTSFLQKCILSRLGGLDLSRSCLDRDSRSRHWQRAGLDSRDFLDSLKNRSRLSRLVSTVQKTKSRHGLCPKILIFVEISIETLDLDTFKSWSRHFQKSISTSRNLDLDWSRLSRPPTLILYYHFSVINKSVPLSLYVQPKMFIFILSVLFVYRIWIFFLHLKLKTFSRQGYGSQAGHREGQEVSGSGILFLQSVFLLWLREGHAEAEEPATQERPYWILVELKVLKSLTCRNCKS